MSSDKRILLNEKNKKIKYYQNELKRMWSDSDIRQFVGGNTKIIKYSDLLNFRTIEDLLPENNDLVFILIENQARNTGHWTALHKLNNKYTFFDSYGEAIDGELKYISPRLRIEFSENKKILSKMLNGKDVQSNRLKLQELNDSVDTCGRHAAIFGLLSKMGYDLDEIQNFYKTYSEVEKKPFDILSVDWT